MPTVQANGIELAYTVQGAGEPLLLISGFNCDRTYWSLVVPPLAEHYQIIRFDNRGSGQSSDPDRPYTLQHMAADAAALIDHLGIRRLHVAGHSMGGQIAQELALARPELVQSLSIISSWALANQRFNLVIEALGDLPGAIELSLYQKVVLPWVYGDGFYSTPGAIEQLIELWNHHPFPASAHGLYHQSRAILQSHTDDRLKDIHCPTLVLVGKEDILTPVKFSEQLADGIAHAELVVLEQGGHGLLIEFPETVAMTMLNFLTKQGKFPVTR